MKISIFILAFSLNSILVFAQTPNNPISILRYNDNFSAVKNETNKTGFNKLKHIALGKHANISFGGELREQYQYFDNLNFGDIPPTFKQSSAGQLWHRIMGHSNIEIGKKVRIFTQLNSTFRFLNPNPITPEIDENQLSLHQAFIDYNVNKNWQVRVGRQEIGYGNNRLVTFREGPNTRLTFNGAIIKYKNAKRKIDILAITPVVSMQKVFDDVSFKEYVFGVYGTENFIPKKLMIDYYALGFLSDNRKYNYAAGKENRQSFGVRFFSQNSKLNYELETTYQTGKFANQNISAYGLSADVNYKIEKTKNVVVGIGANYFTGDKNKAVNQLNTYNLLFSKPSYGLSAPLGSSNLINVNPYVKLTPIKKLSLLAGVYLLQRQSNQDGTYSPNMTQVRPTPAIVFASTKKSIGTQYALEVNYDLNKHVSFALDGAYFNAGNYVAETGKGKNITYVAFKGAFKF
jgi:hypothetical protein